MSEHENLPQYSLEPGRKRRPYKHKPTDIPGLLIDEDERWRIERYRYFVKENGYVVSFRAHYGKPKFFKLHREIMNAPPGVRVHVDHINGNKLDNRKCNLRVTDHRTNAQNMKVTGKRSRSGVRNVMRLYGKWGVRVRGADGKTYQRSGFDTIEEAAKVAEEMRRQYLPGYVPREEAA